VRNASVGAGASGGQSWNVQSGRYNKPAGCSTPVACRGRPCKQTNKQTTYVGRSRSWEAYECSESQQYSEFYVHGKVGIFLTIRAFISFPRATPVHALRSCSLLLTFLLRLGLKFVSFLQVSYCHIHFSSIPCLLDLIILTINVVNRHALLRKRILSYTWRHGARAVAWHGHLHKAPYTPHFQSDRCWNSISIAASCESIWAKSQSKAFVYIHLENSVQSRLKFLLISLKRR
jgi:hypothetical protein